MRERDINARKFHKGHYEIIAKQFRVALEPWFDAPPTVLERQDNIKVRNALVNLALNFALRFQADSELFDPDIFLTRCSPDPDKWPLAELWIGFVEKDQHSRKVD